MDESVVQDMMMLADTDRDDKVSLDEFKMIMRAGPKSKPSSRPSVPSSGGVGKNGVRRRRRSRSDVFAGEAAGGGRDSVNDPSSGVTHFLLLLNRRTFVGERGKRLAHTLRAALGLPDPDELITLTAEQERASSERSLLKACSHLKQELDRFKLQSTSLAPSDLDGAAGTAANRQLRARIAAVRPYLKSRTLPELGAAGARREGSPRQQPGAQPPDRSRRTARRGRDFLAGAAGEASRIKLLLVHSVDAQEDGCEFDHFFSVTPPDLVHAGQVFHQPAVPLFSSPAFRAVSIELVVAQQHGLERPLLAADHPPLFSSPSAGLGLLPGPESTALAAWMLQRRPWCPCCLVPPVPALSRQFQRL